MRHVYIHLVFEWFQVHKLFAVFVYYYRILLLGHMQFGGEIVAVYWLKLGSLFTKHFICTRIQPETSNEKNLVTWISTHSVNKHPPGEMKFITARAETDKTRHYSALDTIAQWKVEHTPFPNPWRRENVCWQTFILGDGEFRVLEIPCLPGNVSQTF